MNYGINIKSLRERNGVTQKTLAEFLGIDGKLYSHYETEDRIIPCKHIILISEYFDENMIMDKNEDIRNNRLAQLSILANQASLIGNLDNLIVK